MTEKLFFNPQRRMEINWRNNLHLHIGSVGPRNKGQISEGLRYMSPESIRYRFLGSKRAFTDKELKYLTSLDGMNHYALGVEIVESLLGIAIIRMVRSSENENEAEVAITILDKYQKIGLGSLLMKLMILAASERNIERLSFTYLPQNEGIVRLISKFGNLIQGAQNKDYVQTFLDLKTIDLKKIKAQLLPDLPEIGTFHLKI